MSKFQNALPLVILKTLWLKFRAYLVLVFNQSLSHFQVMISDTLSMLTPTIKLKVGCEDLIIVVAVSIGIKVTVIASHLLYHAF
jgi:hypothetical protein